MDLGAVVAHFLIEPAARVHAARFSGQRQPPLAEMLAQEFFFESSEIAYLANAPGLQILFGDLADAGDFSHIERREKARLFARQHPENAVGLGLVGRHFGHHARCRDADGTIEIGVALDGVVQAMRGGKRRSVQALGSGEIHVGFVHRRHVHLR